MPVAALGGMWLTRADVTSGVTRQRGVTLCRNKRAGMLISFKKPRHIKRPKPCSTSYNATSQRRSATAMLLTSQLTLVVVSLAMRRNQRTPHETPHETTEPGKTSKTRALDVTRYNSLQSHESVLHAAYVRWWGQSMCSAHGTHLHGYRRKRKEATATTKRWFSTNNTVRGS